MASWKDSFSKFAQSAVSKSKEMAEVTRLNLDTNTQEQKIKDLYATMGEYVMERPELVSAEDETFAAGMVTLNELKEKIEQNRAALLALRNVALCPACGIEISRDNKFCPGCGAPVVLPQVVAEPEETAAQEDTVEVAAEMEADKVCSACGAPVEANAVFCGECGAKVNE